VNERRLVKITYQNIINQIMIKVYYVFLILQLDIF